MTNELEEPSGRSVGGPGEEVLPPAAQDTDETIASRTPPPGLPSGKATISSKGQVTIPASVRERLSLKPGDRVTFTVLANGTTIMRRKNRSISELAGSVKPENGRHATIEELGFD